MSVWFLLIPALTAFIGWLLNKSLVYFLFGSAEGGQTAAILKDRQQKIGVTLPDVVIDRFLSPDKINGYLTGTNHFEKVKPVIEEHMDDFLRNRLKIVFPVISMFIGDKTINDLKGHFMVELEQLFPVVMNKYAGSIVNPEEIRGLISKEILDADISAVVHQHFSKEIQLFTIWGALTGFICGLLTLLLLIFLHL
jgi:uncharacterized membrane protein YheB (UPF0754 family)